MLDRYWSRDNHLYLRINDRERARLVVDCRPDAGVDPYLWCVTVEGVGSASGRAWTVHRAKLAATRAYLRLTGQERKIGRPRKTA